MRQGPDASGDGAGQVGEDVAEEVVGDDHVEATRVRDQMDGGRIDVGIVYGDSGCSSATASTIRFHMPPALTSNVRLVHRGSACSGAARRGRTRSARPGSTPRRGRTVEVSFATSCTVPVRIDPPLPTYGPSVPSRTTTKLDLARVGERAGNARVELLGGPQVHVVVEREAQLPAAGRARCSRPSGRGSPTPDGAEEDRGLRWRSP